MKPATFDNLGFYIVRLINDMIFYIIVDILLIYMINGIIISSFSQLGDETQQKDDDKENKCFICSIDKYTLKKNKNNLKDHYSTKHLLKNYIYYLVNLLDVDTKEMDSDQSIIYKKLKIKDIGFFPIKKKTSQDDK